MLCTRPATCSIGTSIQPRTWLPVSACGPCLLHWQRLFWFRSISNPLTQLLRNAYNPIGRIKRSSFIRVLFYRSNCWSCSELAPRLVFYHRNQIIDAIVAWRVCDNLCTFVLFTDVNFFDHRMYVWLTQCRISPRLLRSTKFLLIVVFAYIFLTCHHGGPC